MIFMIAEKLACSILDGNSMTKISSKIYIFNVRNNFNIGNLLNDDRHDYWR
jgi:hypothetical protein